MKRYVINRILIAGLALLSVPAASLAQNEKVKEKTKENKKVQQIIITREGDMDDKTVIEIKGNKVLINGKEAKDNANVHVHVNTNTGRNIFRVDRDGQTWQGTPDLNFNFDNDFDNGAISLFSEDANRAMLGVVTDEADKGAKITSITRESGADKAGLKVGDVITKIGDEEVEDADDVSKAVRKHKPGDKVTVTVLRDEKEQKITAELGKWKGVRLNNLNATIAPAAPFAPDAPRPYRSFSFNNGGPKLGLSVQDTDDGKGVKVLDVAEESNAAKAGIKKDDIITQINEDEVNTTDEVRETMREARNEASVKLQVLRNGKSQTIDVRIPRKLKTADL